MPHSTPLQRHGATSDAARRNNKRRARIRFLVGVFDEYGHRTTVHGLSHMYQSADFRRRFFWLCLTVVSIVACVVHIYFIIANYMETPVNSVILHGTVRQEFPDVTFCNMKPISESAQFHGRNEIHHLFKSSWNFFNDWLLHNETYTVVDLYNHFRTFIEVFWVSEDTRDLAHDDDVTVVYCKYKGRRCSASAFKMIQNLQYWNCYTFFPEETGQDRDIYSGSYEEGLSVILYTNTVLLDLHPMGELARISSSISSTSGETADRFIDLISKSNQSLNKLLYGDRLEPGGMRIILHEKGTYPHISKNSFIVGNGEAAVVEFNMEYKEMINRPEHKCRQHTDELSDTIEYTTFYPGKNVRKKNFKRFHKNRFDFIVEKTQQLFFKYCGCYTHQMPFNCFNTKLCYFCANGTSYKDIKKTLKNVHCHDEAFETKFKKEALSFYKKSEDFQPCKLKEYRAKIMSSQWPIQDDIVYLINEFVIPAFREESVGGNFYNHILKKTKVFPLYDIINMTTHGNTTTWNTTEYLMRNSFLKVTIHGSEPTGTLHQEVESYSFAEALSEIGGIFGLYAGLSILTFFEFIELFYLMLSKPKEVQEMEGEGQSKYSIIRKALTPQELQSARKYANRDGNDFARGDLCNQSEMKRYTDLVMLNEDESETMYTSGRPLAFNSHPLSSSRPPV